MQYFFSFFASGKEAIAALRDVVDNSDGIKSGKKALPTGDEPTVIIGSNQTSAPESKPVPARLSSFRRPSNKSPGAEHHGDAPTPLLRESVRATLSPVSPTRACTPSGRPSLDSRRPSLEASRRSSDFFRPERRSFDMHSRDRSGGRRVHSLVRHGQSPLVSEIPSTVASSGSSGRETDLSGVVQSIDDTTASGSQILDRSDVFQSPTIARLRQSKELGRSEEDRAGRSSNEEIVPHSQRSTRATHTGSSNEASQPPTGTITSPAAVEHSNSSSALQDLVRAGSDRASGLAGYLKTGSKKMGSLLSSGPLEAYEKVSGMWAGGKRHYGGADGLVADDSVPGPEDDEDALTHGDRFRTHFALPSSEQLTATYFGWLYRVLPLYGKIYIGQRVLCFRSLIPGSRTKVCMKFRVCSMKSGRLIVVLLR